MSEGGDIFAPSNNRDLYREAELITLRQMSTSMQALTTEMVSHRETLSSMQTDIAVIKEKQTSNAELRDMVTKLSAEVQALKDRNLRQDGAYNFVQIMKDFGPWVVSLLVLAWGLFQRGPR